MPEPSDNSLKELSQLIFIRATISMDIAAEWTGRPALRQLVETFGGSWPTHVDLERKLEHLSAFSELWDQHKGGSRTDMSEIAESDHGQYSSVPDIADALGLVSQLPPSRTDPDYVVILDGLAVGNRVRIACSSELAGRGLVS